MGLLNISLSQAGPSKVGPGSYLKWAFVRMGLLTILSGHMQRWACLLSKERKSTWKLHHFLYTS